MRYESDSMLCHHGIKGQHWGVRRFQNEDGTLTEEGKDRYLVGKEYHEEQKKYEKEEAEKLEKKNANVQKMKKDLEDLRKEYDLDENGKRTAFTNRNKYSNWEIYKAERKHDDIKNALDKDMSGIHEKAHEKAVQKIVKKHGETALKDIEHYQHKNTVRGLTIAGIITAAIAVPLAFIFGRSHKQVTDNYNKSLKGL